MSSKEDIEIPLQFFFLDGGGEGEGSGSGFREDTVNEGVFPSLSLFSYVQTDVRV